jgi:hypothetical protein
MLSLFVSGVIGTLALAASIGIEIGINAAFN